MPVLQVEMTDRDVMARVGRLMGRKVVASKPRRAHWSPTYKLRIAGGLAVEWMLELHPLMGERRQRQMERAIRSYQPRTTRILSDSDGRQAIDLLADGASVRQVAERFGVTIWCIYDLRLGRTHRGLDRSRLATGLASPR